MRGWVTRQGLIAGILVASAVTAGCSTDSIAPPPSGKVRSSSTSTSGAMPVRAKEVVLILPAEQNGDLTLYDLIGRNEAGQLKVFYRLLRPSPGDAPSKQAELIKQAVADGASALVVVPDATKETAEALAGLDPKKTPVVLLGRTPAGGAPASMTQVTFESFDISAKALVQALVEGEKVFGIKPDAPALLLTITPPDETTAERDAALVAALKAAKIPVLATVPLTSDAAAAEKPIKDAAEKHPEIGAIVCDDEASLAAAHVMRRLFHDRTFVVVGYFVGKNNAPNFMLKDVPAIAERSIEMLVRRAFRIAVDRAEGREAPAKAAIEITVRRGALNAGSPGSAAPTAVPKEFDARKSPPPDERPGRPGRPGRPDVKKAAQPEPKKGP